MLVEVLGGFDYSAIAAPIAERIQSRLDRVNQLCRQTVYGTVEIGVELLAIKGDLVEERVYRRWLETEFPWGKSTANQLEAVAIRFANVQQLDNFDITALYVLAAPSTPDAVREKAIALAGAGERISAQRAKALRNGEDVLALETGKQIAVQSGNYQGQSVTVRPGAPAGLVNVVTPSGEDTTLLISELMPEEVPEPVPKPRPETPNHLAAIATELEIERDRLALLEDVLRRVCIAARAGALTDKLLSEAEALID